VKNPFYGPTKIDLFVLSVPHDFKKGKKQETINEDFD